MTIRLETKRWTLDLGGKGSHPRPARRRVSQWVEEERFDFVELGAGASYKVV